MAKTGLLLDPAFARHDTGWGHPERPERIEALLSSIAQNGLAEACQTVLPASIDDVWILENHSVQYLQRLQSACERGLAFIDSEDSAIGPDSLEIARLAAGGVLNCIDGVMSGRLGNAFAAVRPPGHHAEYNLSMGFCLLNNVAIAARYLLRHYGLSRVMIFDFDVHHGNGTQHSFEETPEVFFCSFHQHPFSFYPGTGFDYERGRGAGEGTTLNCPMVPGSKDEDYRRAFEEKFVPAFNGYKPEFVLLSAGFDAHEDDLISRIELVDASFDWLTRSTLELAREHCGGRVVSMLEGGYNLAALCRCVELHVRGLLEYAA